MSTWIVNRWEEILGRTITERPNFKGEILTFCPFHDDKASGKRSFSLNLNSGVAKCHGSCMDGWSVESATAKHLGISVVDAKKKLGPNVNRRPVMDSNLIEQYHSGLVKSKKIRRDLRMLRGINRSTLEQYRIGWDGDMVTVPIKNADDYYINIRTYDLLSLRGKGKNRTPMHSIAGFGGTDIFPIENLNSTHLLITEGEMDCLLANQMGIPTISFTAGAGSLPKGVEKLLAGKIIYIAYDNDAAGVNGATKVAVALRPYATEIKILRLPVQGQSEDFTDWVLKYGGTKSAFKKLIRKTDEFKKLTLPKISVKDSKVHVTTMQAAAEEAFYNKRVKFRAYINGKAVPAYMIPAQVEAKCDIDQDRLCASCSLSTAGGILPCEFSDDNPEVILDMADKNKRYLQNMITDHLQINPRCRAWEFETVKVHNMERVTMIPDLDDDEAMYEMRTGYYLGQAVEVNQTVELTGVTLPDPNSQQVTMMIYEMHQADDALRAFKMDPTIYKQLKKFQVRGKQTVSGKYTAIIDDLQKNVFHQIVGRGHLIRIMDLTYHSILQFNMTGYKLERGHLEPLIIGDTGTGKSTLFRLMRQHYQFGKLITSEGSTEAGLVGGLQQVGGKWQIQWGALPQNNKRLLFLDEASGLSQDLISKLSGVRSEGIVQITKIQQQVAQARLRLIVASNPRDNKGLHQYNFGIESVRDLIRDDEDISRFDIVAIASMRDVPKDDIYTTARGAAAGTPTFDTESCHQLVLWACSRKVDDVVFDGNTEDILMDAAKAQASRYTTAIPIVSPASHHETVARFAVAIAARLFSTDRTGEKILVKPDHVHFAIKILDEEYGRVTNGYQQMSAVKKMESKVSPAEIKKTRVWIRDNEHLARLLLQANEIHPNLLVNMGGVSVEEARSHISTLFKGKMLTNIPGGRGIVRYKKHERLHALLIDELGST